MRLISGLILFVILAIGFNACFDPPQFSIIPLIEFNSIVFKPKKASVPRSQDTLLLILNFKDGDGDLGLDSSDVNYPYENKDYYFKTGVPIAVPQGVTAVNTDTLITFKNKRQGNDTLPDFAVPYCCTRWDIFQSLDSTQLDTLYMRLNPNFYNIFIDIYVQQADGTFALFDWTEEFPCNYCEVIGYNGRFPILASDLSKKAPLEGQIKYGMTSSLWTAFFSIKTLQLKVRIVDRALNTSNTITTNRFRLSDITQN